MPSFNSSFLSPEDIEPIATTPNHELDPGHMSGAEEAPPTITPVPVVPSPDDSAKEVTKQEVDVEVSPEEEEVEDEEEAEEDVLPSSERQGVVAERLDSVTIDPSFNPSGEELLYEGDMDVEPAVKSAADKDNSSQDEGFIVNVHETSMELESSESLRSKSTVTATSISIKSGGGGGGSGNSESLSSCRHPAGAGETTSKPTPSSKSVSSSERKKPEASSSSTTGDRLVGKCNLMSPPLCHVLSTGIHQLVCYFCLLFFFVVFFCFRN